jgi:peptide/nickel transport system permease protein
MSNQLDIDAATVAGPTGVHVRSRRGGVSFVVVGAMVALLIVLVCAAFGPWLAPHDPNEQDLLVGLTGPSSQHWLGTDDLGRDILSRTIVGTRSAVVGPLIIALGAMTIGVVLGLLAGYNGGAIDSGISRWVELVYALPALLVAIVVVGVFGGGYFLAVGLLVILFSPVDTRIARAAALDQRSRPYVEAARLLDLPRRQIIFRHIWPNAMPYSLANAFLTFAFALVSLAALSYLGLGVGPGTADWGRMLSESRELLFDNPAAAIAPGVAIALTAVSVSIVGDWLSERLSERGRSR